MNGEIPSVPITTLAGVASLTDLLPELPLPSPMPHTMNNKSLLYHSKVAEEAKRLLASREDNLVSQLVQALHKTNTDHIDLKDNMAGDSIEGEIPALLQAILAKDPDVFKGGNVNNSDHAAIGNEVTGSQPYNQAPEHPSPYQAGQISPCPPGSPARLPPQPGGSPYASQTAFPNRHQSSSKNQKATSAKFQDQFLMFANKQPETPTVNGGLSSSPGTQGGSTPPALKHKTNSHSKSSTVSSPAQIAPPIHMEDSNDSSDHKRSARRHSRGSEPVVVIKPLGEDNPSPAKRTRRRGRSANKENNERKKFKEKQKILNASQTKHDAPCSTNSFLKKPETNRSSNFFHQYKNVIEENSKPDNCKPQKIQNILPGNKGVMKESNSKGTLCIQEKNKKLNKSLKTVRRSMRHRENDNLKNILESDKIFQEKNSTGDEELLQPTIKLTRLESIPQDEINRLKVKQRNKLNEERRGLKRNRGEEDDWIPSGDEFGAYTPSLSERVKRRRRQALIIDDESDEGENITEHRVKERKHRSPSPEVRKKKKDRKHRRYNDLMMTATEEELMDSSTFKRFNAAIEQVLESAEDLDVTAMNADDEEEEATHSSDAIISRTLLTDLHNEAAKLKSMGVMNRVPYGKLVKLLAILQLTIKDGVKMAAFGGDDSREEEALWRELTVEKITAAVDASLTALYVMTSPNMPKQVYLEDVIERLVMMVKMQLQNTIFPEFDPVYRIDPKNKHGVQSNMKMKRARASGNIKHKSTLNLYNKLSELVGIMAELIDIQELTDTIILQTSTLSVSPFFVENISELQLNSLKLVTNIFARYEKHRQLIMEDILSSLARLPSSKKNLRNYRLNSEEQIQMMTALALQLIQCVVRLPHPEGSEEQIDDPEERERRERRRKRELAEQEVVIVTSYETSMRTAHNFLSVFLRKCAMKGEEDYRPLFEHFVYDLLATVNKPEWPAAELILSLLGRLLVQQFSNKSVDMSMRVASLDYLGIVAARLRKDAITSRLNENTIHEVLREINEDSDDEENKKENSMSEETDADKTQKMQKALLEYLFGNVENDPALAFARQFYIAQWYRDCSVEADKLNKQQKKMKNNDAEDAAEELEESQRLLQVNENKKGFLLSQIMIKAGAFSSYKPSSSALDYDNGCLVTRFLASNRPFSHSFDIYLTQILKVLCETAVAVRTKAMKCLAAVVEADPGILGRTDMQNGVHGRFLDQSTSVREAAVELVGKFILIRPELTVQYYDMLSERILDTGISVRKRVIKIFRDICMEQPSFPKIPEMCVRMIRRVNDEEGIKKLVNDTFQQMWFTPSRGVRGRSEGGEDVLLHRVMNITDVVSACKETGYDWFEQLLENLLKKEEDASNKPVEKACLQLINCLIENILKQEESNVDGTKGSSPRLIACISTLHLFCKTKPDLLVEHVQTIQPYLNIRCQTQGDFLVIHNVARILELAVPLMEHPGESFMAQLEEDMMKLILKHGMTVLVSCVSCLGAVVNNVTHNYKLVRDCFQKFFGVLSKLLAEHKRDATNPEIARSKPTLLRALFTVGLLCKHFDFDSEDFGEKKVSIRDRVFDVMMYFLEHEDEDVKNKSLTGLGYFCTRHFEFMLEKQLRDVYHEFLGGENTPLKMKCQVLRNLSTYLTEEEVKMIKADHEWKKRQEKEDLKEMGDVQSGMASTVIQLYLKQVLEAFIHHNAQVRMNALGVVCLILKQGLVHPVQCVPYLICMGTDCDNQVRIKADQQLLEIDKKYAGFIQMKALNGMKFSYRLQCMLQDGSDEPVRGVREDQDNPVALNSYLYTLIRGSRSHRRALLSSLLNMFDETTKVPMPELIYVADNLAFFPYQTQDEPLYIIHQIDILVSVSGSNILQSFREYFYPGSSEERKRLDDDEDVDIEVLLDAVTSRIQSDSGKKKAQDLQHLQDLYMASQSCVLLLVLKQHLKEIYGFTDSKIHRYSPTESAKIFDKQVGNRKNGVRFTPKQVLEIVKKGALDLDESEEHRRMLVETYLDFKDLMLSIDPDDDEDEDDKDKVASGRATPVAAAGSRTPTGEGSGADGAAPPQEGGQAPAADGEAQVNTSAQGGAEAVTPKPVETTPVQQYHHHSSSSSSSHHRDHHRHHHRTPRTELAAQLSGHNDRKRNRQSNSSSHRSSSHSHSHSSSKHHHSKPHKHKKKKKRRRHSDDEDDETSDDSDPDFVC